VVVVVVVGEGEGEEVMNRYVLHYCVFFYKEFYFKLLISQINDIF
jgi:hypothetical protein